MSKEFSKTDGGRVLNTPKLTLENFNTWARDAAVVLADKFGDVGATFSSGVQPPYITQTFQQLYPTLQYQEQDPVSKFEWTEARQVYSRSRTTEDEAKAKRYCVGCLETSVIGVIQQREGDYTRIMSNTSTISEFKAFISDQLSRKPEAVTLQEKEKARRQFLDFRQYDPETGVYLDLDEFNTRWDQNHGLCLNRGVTFTNQELIYAYPQICVAARNRIKLTGVATLSAMPACYALSSRY
jgi:hypothetical protein